MNRITFPLWVRVLACAGIAFLLAGSAATAQFSVRGGRMDGDRAFEHRGGNMQHGSRHIRRNIPHVRMHPHFAIRDGDNRGEHCRKGYVWGRGHCVKTAETRPRECPPGWHRQSRKCVKTADTGRKCPPGTRGKPPHCVKIGVVTPSNSPKECPPGTRGRPPECVARSQSDSVGGGGGPTIDAGPSAPPPAGNNATISRDTPGALPPLTPPVVEVPRFRPNELVVMIRAPQPDNVAATLAQSFNVNLQETVTLNLLPNVRVYRFGIPDNRSVEALAASISATPDVSAMPNYYHRLQGNDTTRPESGPQTSAEPLPQYALPKMKVPDAQNIATGKGVSIAVIDTGVDAKHPVFAKSDLQLLDMVGDAGAQPDKHGTAIAGLIAGRGGIKGVAPDAKVLAIRAFAPEGKNMPAVTTSLRLARAVDVAFDKGARIFNMSFAGPRDQLLNEMIDAAYAKGAVFIAAAGNNGPGAPPAFPAAYEKVIAITATDETDKLYAKANRGRYVTASAPGVEILVPVTGNGFDYETGTSFAAAHVSGIVALLKERNPKLTPEEVRQILVGTARHLTKKEATEENEDYGAGLADALASVQKAQAN